MWLAYCALFLLLASCEKKAVVPLPQVIPTHGSAFASLKSENEMGSVENWSQVRSDQVYMKGHVLFFEESCNHLS